MNFKTFLKQRPSSLNESPYDANQELSVQPWDTYTSDAGLNAGFNHLFDIKSGGSLFSVYMNKRAKQVRVYTKAVKPSGVESNKEVMFINFKNVLTVSIKASKILQVDLTKIEPTFAYKGIASKVYKGLVKQGYTIISDNTHYTGGKMLWKKLALDSMTADHVKVYIWDEIAKDYIRDVNDKPIQYNSSNIDDLDIWSSGFDFSKTDVVLTMTALI